MLDNKTTTDCRNKRIKEAKIRSFLKSVVVCFVRHLTDHYRNFHFSFLLFFILRAWAIIEGI